MPRGQYARRPRTTQAITSIEVTGLIPKEMFTSLQWFKKSLNESEQAAVINESQLLASSLQKFGQSRLEIGAHLIKLQAILEPHNLFQRYLKHFHFSKRTAYRYIAKYKNAQALPEPILAAAMSRGIDIGGETELKPYGVYTDAVKQLPPPVNANVEQAVTYLTQLDNVRKTAQTAAAAGAGPTVVQMIDPQTAIREIFKFAQSRLKKLPNNKRTKTNVVLNVFALMLTEVGAETAQTVSPQPIPAEFAPVKRGRPAGSVAVA